MTPDQRQRMNELCEKIQKETDQKEFVRLIYELNVLLEEGQEALGDQPATQS